MADRKNIFALGGQDRVFAFVRGDRSKLEKEFCGSMDYPGLFDWIYKRVFPITAAGVATMGGNWDSQVAFVHAAIRHNCKVQGREVTREKVEEWLYDLIDADGIVAAPVTVAIAAGWECGIFGRKMIIAPIGDPDPKEDGVTSVTTSNSSPSE